MSYLVLARKWRPLTFTDLVGQEHVKRTLENAIAQNRVAHAFLFTGVRGVGKTTSARILAKALSCEKGPTATPCLACAACLEIAQGTDTDCQEIDGASYTGVDDVRRLQETIPYRPQRDRFKIFIVDEVHMLSNNAWNAFLKTLEEPPPHVKFIFATTEVHKVPATILSRCQRYDFKMISVATIAARLRHVLSAESIEADEAAVQILAREARGSMRDAMSLLDQAIAWGGTTLRGEEVARVLGVASRHVLLEIAKHVLAGEPAPALDRVADLVENGYDLTHVTRDLLSVFRDLVVAKVAPGSDGLLDATSDEREILGSVVAGADADDLVRLHQGFSRAYDDIVAAGLPRGSLEMALVRLARRPALEPMGTLIAKLADVERRLGGDGGPRPSGGGGGGGGGGPMRREGPPPQQKAPPASRPSFPRTEGNLATLPSRPPEPPPRAVPPPSSPRPVAPAPSVRPAPPPSVRLAQKPSLQPDPLEPLPPPPPEVDVERLRALVEAVRSENLAFASIVERAAPRAVSAERVVLAFVDGSFEAGSVASPEAVELLRRAARSSLGPECSVAIELAADAGRGFSLARLLVREEAERKAALVEKATAHPLVRAVMSRLEAEVTSVTLAGDQGSRLSKAQRPGKV